MKTMKQIALAGALICSTMVWAQEVPSPPAPPAPPKAVDTMKIVLNDSTEINVNIQGLNEEQKAEMEAFIRSMAEMVVNMNSSKMNLWMEDEDGGFEFSFDLNPDSLEQRMERWAEDMERWAEQMEADMERAAEEAEKQAEEAEKRAEEQAKKVEKWKFNFGENGFSVEEESEAEDKIQWEFENPEDETPEAPKEPKAFETDNMFQIGFGFSNHLNADGKFLSRSQDPYALKTWGSGVFDLHWNFKTRMGKKGPVYLKYGLGFSFYEWSLDSDRYLEQGSQMVSFSNDSTINMKKSKFSNSQITLPIMFMLDFDEDGDEDKFHLGVGGFVGYRIGASTIRKYEASNGNKVRQVERGSFFMNDFQYGLQAQIGVSKVRLFARYHLNSLFETGAGPDVNPISFGIVF